MRTFTEEEVEILLNSRICEKPKTNADRIRSMSDEELEKFISKVNRTCIVNALGGDTQCDYEDVNCTECKKRTSTANNQVVESTKKTDEEIIKEYESIPNHNILSRGFSGVSTPGAGRPATQAEIDYNRKQELQSDYQQAKNRQIANFLSANNISDSTLALGITITNRSRFVLVCSTTLIEFVT